MAAERKAQTSRWTTLYGIIFVGLVLLRIVANYSGRPGLVPALVGLGLFSTLYFSERTISRRLAWYIHAYLGIQTALILLLFSLPPFLDVIGALFILLGLQATQLLPQRLALGWVTGFGIALTVAEVMGTGLLGGLVISMLIAAVGIFLVSYDLLYTRAQIEESQALLENSQPQTSSSKNMPRKRKSWQQPRSETGWHASYTIRSASRSSALY